jgi:hypothetical protein
MLSDLIPSSIKTFADPATVGSRCKRNGHCRHARSVRRLQDGVVADLFKSRREENVLPKVIEAPKENSDQPLPVFNFFEASDGVWK